MEIKISQILKQKRKELKLPVEFVTNELLKQSGIKISPKTLYGYESGNRQPNAKTLLSICSIYGISDLLEELGYKKSVTKKNPESFTSVEQELIRKYRFLDERGKIMVDTILDNEYFNALYNKYLS